MTDQPDTSIPAESLQQMRALLAAIQREAANKGAVEVADLVKKVDDLAASLLARETH